MDQPGPGHIVSPTSGSTLLVSFVYSLVTTLQASHTHVPVSPSNRCKFGTGYRAVTLYAVIGLTSHSSCVRDLCGIAGTPRRRHRHRHGHPREDPREEIAYVGLKDCSRVWRVGVGVRVRVGAVECQLYPPTCSPLREVSSPATLLVGYGT